jgi:hypothetical protein
MGAKRNRATRAQGTQETVEGRLSERRQLRSGVLADAPSAPRAMGTTTKWASGPRRSP